MLTDLLIKKLAVPDKRREVPDGRIAGLYLVHQPSDAKSWALRFRAAGQPAKLTLGSYPAVSLADARKRAQEALGEVAGGKNPAAAKRATRVAAKAATDTGDSVQSVAAQFMKRYVEKKVGAGWGKEIDRMFRVEILPVIGDKRIGDVRKAHILAILDAIHDRGSPITANRCLAVLRKFFNWATDDRDLIAASPCRGIGAPAEETSRDRVLSDDEIRLAWGAFEQLGWPFGPLAKLLLLTGARRDEIGGARWSEIDLAARTWTIAKERSKNGVAHEIPLSDAAVAVLSGLPRVGERNDAFVFTTTGRTAVSGFSKAKNEIDAAMLDAINAEANGAAVTAPAHWTLHDLRRTAASGMAGMGIAPHVVEAVLNHKSGTIKGIAAVYNRYSYATEKRQALDAWARKLGAIVGGGNAANVIELAKARG